MTLDRFGEDIDEETELQPVHDQRCRRGWLGYDLDGRPIPCITCRPHLFRSETR